MNHKIEIWNVDQLVPYAANAKKHPEDHIRKLAQAIKKFGWTQPIVIWKNGEIIAGHGRRLAAISLGLEKVPVIVRSDLSKTEADAMRLADNRVTSTDYDQGLVQEELLRINEALGLEGSDIEIEDLGFDGRELDFVNADLAEINDSFFVSDVSEAVEQQKRENEQAIETTDDIAAPVGDALGFKRVTIAQSRQLRELMSGIEVRTGKTGVEALIDVLSRES